MICAESIDLLIFPYNKIYYITALNLKYKVYIGDFKSFLYELNRSLC